MKILAIDTSTAYLAMAISDDDKILSKVHKKIGRNHSTLMIPIMDRLLKSVKVRIGEVGVICIGLGPGSFTGLRIGVSTVKGLSHSLNKPVIGVPTMDAIARNVKKFKGYICPVLDARKGKLYACIYRSDGKSYKRISKYLLISAKDLIEKTSKYDNIVFLGDALDLIGKARPKKIDWYPRADNLIRLAREKLQLGDRNTYTRPEKLEPMYLYSRECDITGW